MAKKQIEEQEKEIEDVEENSADKIAELTIEIDNLKEQLENANTNYEKLDKKYQDEHKANIRLMSRINEREDFEEKEQAKKQQKPAKITDLYDFKAGRLVLK